MTKKSSCSQEDKIWRKKNKKVYLSLFFHCKVAQKPRGLTVKPASRKIFNFKPSASVHPKGICGGSEEEEESWGNEDFSSLVRCEPWGRCSSFRCSGQMLLGTHKRDGWPLTEGGKTPERWWWGWRGYLVWAHVVSQVHDLPSLLNKRLFVLPCIVRSPNLEVSLCCYFSHNITLEQLKKKNTLLTCQKLWGFEQLFGAKEKKKDRNCDKCSLIRAVCKDRGKFKQA